MAWMDDIRALLEDASEQMEILVALHERALAHAGARSRFRTRVKNVLENHRSALDYLAVGLTNEHGSPSKSFVVYFPLAQSPGEFPAVMESRMPGVAAAKPKIAEAIERHQPYQPGNEWLSHLNKLTREQKHNALSAQIVREVFQCRVTEKATGAFVMWHGLTLEPGKMVSVGGIMEIRPEPGRADSAPKLFEVGVPPTGFQAFGVPIDAHTQLPWADDRLDVERGPIHQWCFVNPHGAVLNELRSFHSGVIRVVNDVVEAAAL